MTNLAAISLLTTVPKHKSIYAQDLLMDRNSSFGDEPGQCFKSAGACGQLKPQFSPSCNAGDKVSGNREHIVFAEDKKEQLWIPDYLGASNRLGSNRTTTYVIDPSILLNQCGVPAGMMTTSPAFIL